MMIMLRGKPVELVDLVGLQEKIKQQSHDDDDEDEGETRGTGGR